MKYDIIVLGSGPGGYVAAIRASQLGFKTAIVEKESMGGVCLNWGCIPTKALLKSAQVFEYINHAEDYGINVSDASTDFDKIVKRSRNVAEGMSKGVQFLMRKNKIDVIMGYGKVKPGKKIEVSTEEGTKTLEANHIIIATGGRSRVLKGLEQDGKKVIGYREALSLKDAPKKMLIVGSGAIGIEFAYFYNAIGTEVTVVEYMDSIVPREDKDVSKELAKVLKKKGINIITKSAVEFVDTSGEGCKVTVKDNNSDKETIIGCDIVLSAVGVTPNTENIGLEEVGIKTDRGLVQVDEYYKTNVDGYYAIGDIVPGAALAHVASAEGILCVEKIAGEHVSPIDYNNIPSCTYCVPEIASVGYTEDAAKEAGYEIKVGKFPFSASGKASAAGAKGGFVKVIYDAKYGELLGAHMIGYNVTEMIAEIVVARKLETTGHEILKSIHPHPTISEAIMEATADAYGEVIHL
ncbi:MAG: dihydrolipoyl dehydrogenase [Chitinophagales bacterium]|nr:dihydrolipoyl dehydrogenase [Chitinophagales bacterium]